MTTSATPTIQFSSLHDASTPNVTGPILVTTRGDASSTGALRAAKALGASLGAEVRALTVLEPIPIVAPEYGVLVHMPDTDTERERALLSAVRAQVGEATGSDKAWPVEVQRGDPVTTIIRVAHASHARAIVLGIGKHSLMDRLFGSETALHVLRRTDVPVFAVPTDFRALPRVAVVATDFSESSVRAIAEASALFGPFESLRLVHVAPRVDSAADIVSSWEGEYLAGLTSALVRLRSALDLPASTVVESVMLRGDPAKEVLAYAARAKADLIIAGTHGHGLIERMLIGSVATGLLRGAACPVLITPQARHERRTSSWNVGGQEGSLIELTDHADWAVELQEFTNRNAARMSILEIDDPDIGAQAQEIGYPFLGASYDPHDRRVELMLGDDSPEGRHLTRGIGNVREIDILKDPTGRDIVLRVLHGRTQTLLRLVKSL